MLSQWLKKGRPAAARPERTPPALTVSTAAPAREPQAVRHPLPAPREPMLVEEAWLPPPPPPRAPQRPLFSMREPEVRAALHYLRERAITDRLECAIPFLETLAGLLQNEAEKGTPPGVLTVRGWMKLLSQWEFLARHLKNRQLRYLVSFLEELEADVELPCREVLEPVLTELHALFDGRAGETMVEAASSGHEPPPGTRRAA